MIELRDFKVNKFTNTYVDLYMVVNTLPQVKIEINIDLDKPDAKILVNGYNSLNGMLQRDSDIIFDNMSDITNRLYELMFMTNKNLAHRWIAMLESSYEYENLFERIYRLTFMYNRMSLLDNDILNNIKSGKIIQYSNIYRLYNSGIKDKSLLGNNAGDFTKEEDLNSIIEMNKLKYNILTSKSQEFLFTKILKESGYTDIEIDAIDIRYDRAYLETFISKSLLSRKEDNMSKTIELMKKIRESNKYPKLIKNTINKFRVAVFSLELMYDKDNLPIDLYDNIFDIIMDLDYAEIKKLANLYSYDKSLTSDLFNKKIFSNIPLTLKTKDGKYELISIHKNTSYNFSDYESIIPFIASKYLDIFNDIRHISYGRSNGNFNVHFALKTFTEDNELVSEELVLCDNNGLIIEEYPFKLIPVEYAVLDSENFSVKIRNKKEGIINE